MSEGVLPLYHPYPTGIHPLPFQPYFTSDDIPSPCFSLANTPQLELSLPRSYNSCNPYGVDDRRPENDGTAMIKARYVRAKDVRGWGLQDPTTHNSPRVWFLSSALSPLAVRLIRLLLAHGDYVAAGLPPAEMGNEDRSTEFRELINECKSERKDREGWKDRIRGIRCDGRVMGQCGAAVAEAVETFGRIDILLCCTSEAVVGTVEELSTTTATQNLVRSQFETIFFSQVNFIKATLPLLREKHNGHILILTGITGHIGTPGMPMYCASTWALEGYCDSLAYEVAPFNIKMTIVQPNKEISVLTNKIIFAPQLPQYESSNNPAPGLRDILTNVVNMYPETRITEPKAKQGLKSNIVSRYPHLNNEARDKLVMETVHALTAIGGHENPPARHIVGYEGVASVKEKLKTVSEELEDFVEVSYAVDIFKTDGVKAAVSGSSNANANALATAGVTSVAGTTSDTSGS